MTKLRSIFSTCVARGLFLTLVFLLIPFSFGDVITSGRVCVDRSGEPIFTDCKENASGSCVGLPDVGLPSCGGTSPEMHGAVCVTKSNSTELCQESDFETQEDVEVDEYDSQCFHPSPEEPHKCACSTWVGGTTVIDELEKCP
jgi:hypothetical protein